MDVYYDLRCLLFVCSVVFVGCDAAAIDKEIELLKKENKESSENDYKAIIDSLKEWNKGGKIFKGTKLTKISPNKTFAGVLGGYVFPFTILIIFFICI